jgi:hypothetical protein
MRVLRVIFGARGVWGAITGKSNLPLRWARMESYTDSYTPKREIPIESVTKITFWGSLMLSGIQIVD